MNREIARLLELAAEALPECQAEVLAKHCPDPLVRNKVAELLRYAEEAELCFDHAIRGVAASLRTRHEPSPGDVIDCYRIVSVIGRGGMGTVYLAERADGEIQQRVALKLLRADGHRPGWRDRFLKERQLLATLHHPSVVQLFDAGHTEDGRPFLVMEYVDGVSIDRYTAGIDVRERLLLFLRACDGVSHAHRHLIIHRDLKPSNILVDAAGQPKLLDFGIAKLQNETSDATQTREQMLTPNYASPEQLRGEAQSTATDIYSLGIVLYELLTGVALRETARPSADAELAPPSRRNPQLPRDMDFVIGKALRPVAEDRYGSVDDFANDVRAVLEHRPVQARAGDAWYRARRYLRRYWVPLVASLLIVASLSCGLWIADRERRSAKRRFTEVRQLANKLVDIDVQVAQLPGGTKTRQLIVDTALDYLRRITGDISMQPGLALELGAAYMRVGRVQGVNISPNLGQTERAEQSEKMAQTFIDAVLQAQPANPTALLRAGQIAHDRMILAGDMHREDEALRFGRAALERFNQYLRVHSRPDRMEAQQVILALINIANRYSKAGEYSEAIQVAERAIEIARATDWPTQAGAALMVVAFVHRDKGELDEALQAIGESIRLLEPSGVEHRPGRLQPYSLALIRQGQILGEPQSISLNRPREAAKSLQQALTIGEDLARRDPQDFQSQYRVFSAETKLADILRDREPGRALKMYDDALRRLAGATGNGGTARNEAITLADSTYPLLRLGRRHEARRRLDAVFERLSRLGEYPAERIGLGSPAVEALHALAEYQAQGGDLARAAATYKHLIGLMDAGRPSHEISLEGAVELSGVYGAAARVLRKAERTEVAADIESRRLNIWLDWETKLPNNAFVRRQVEAARFQASFQM